MGQDSKYLGIGPKIIVMVFALVVITSCAVGLSTYWQFNEALVQGELDELSTLARVASIRCTGAFKTLQDDALALSSLPTVDGLVRARQTSSRVDPVDGWSEQRFRDRLANAFAGVLRAKPQYSQIRLIGVADNGREIVRVDRLGPDGGIRVVDERELQAKGQRRYMQQAIQLPPGQPWLSEFELNREGPDDQIVTPHEPVIRAATAVHTPDGKPFGIVIINRAVAPLFEEIRLNLDEGQTLRIANDRGDYLMHPDESNAFAFEDGESLPIQNEFPELRSALSEPSVQSSAAVHDSPHSGRSAIGICKAPFDPTRPERFLTFAVSVPYDSIIAASHAARTTSLFASLAVLVPALAIGYALSRSLAKPLQQIAAAAQAFGRGQKNVALPLSAGDEAGVVARTLHGAMQQIRNRTESLEMEVAERKRVELTVREQSARINAIVNGVIDAIITIDPRGIVESVNPAAERMFGYAAAEMIGQNVKMLMPEPYRGEHDRYLDNYLKTGVPKIIGIGREVVGVRKDGTQFPIDLAVTEVELGGRRMFTGVVRDITVRKRNEADLLAANRELARRAASIERFNKQLARSNDELKQFAYVASHDLQEPLRKVTSFCEMLRDEYRGRLDGEALTYIEYAVSGALRMKALVTDLLEYSRVETQGQPLMSVDASEALSEAVDNLEMLIEEAGAAVECDPVPTIAADRAQLIRLFQNLIGNAIKYRSDAPPRVHVWAESQDDEWIIHVEDNGIGIDPQYHARIFVIFQRLHSREAYAGTGIGLAVCKRIVERFGGRIWVESTLGEGSDFCFALPKVESVIPDHETEGQTNDQRMDEYAVQAN